MELMELCSLKKMGYRGVEFLVGYYKQNGENAATMDLGWRLELEVGFRDFRTAYVCVMVDGQWRIMSAVAYEGAYIDNAS